MNQIEELLWNALYTYQGQIYKKIIFKINQADQNKIHQILHKELWGEIKTMQQDTFHGSFIWEFTRTKLTTIQSLTFKGKAIQKRKEKQC